ncbi:MAG: hypothetical protein QM539_05170 [Alphaproteobacteria bacterium]|nr:hypothetical protein [Alphaproteobacteria bacterium]
MEKFILGYFIIGLIYALINVFVRKLETNGDYLLPFIWMFFWPITIPVLLYSKYSKNSNN